MSASPSSSLVKASFCLVLLLLLAACQPAVTATVPPSAAPLATRTPTPSPSASPQPTATFTLPAPTVLPRFFTEEFEGQLPEWAVLQSNHDLPPQTRIEQGALTFELEAPYQWAYAVVGAEQYADVRIDAMIQSRGTSPEALGLICRYSEANGWYEFNVSGDGTYSVLFGQWLAPGVANYAPIASDHSEYLKPGGAQNEVGLACQGDTLWLYINGKLFRKLDVSRFGLAEGRLGLAAASFENIPVTGAFEWVKVSQP